MDDSVCAFNEHRIQRVFRGEGRCSDRDRLHLGLTDGQHVGMHVQREIAIMLPT